MSKTFMGIVGVVLTSTLALAIFSLTIVYRVNRNSTRLRTAAYRLCERDNYIRAFAAMKDHDDRVFLRRYLPILDCTPNLRGEAATELTAKQQDAYIKNFREGKLPPLPEGKPR